MTSDKWQVTSDKFYLTKILHVIQSFPRKIWLWFCQDPTFWSWSRYHAGPHICIVVLLYGTLSRLHHQIPQKDKRRYIKNKWSIRSNFKSRNFIDHTDDNFLHKIFTAFQKYLFKEGHQQPNSQRVPWNFNINGWLILHNRRNPYNYE